MGNVSVCGVCVCMHAYVCVCMHVYVHVKNKYIASRHYTVTEQNKVPSLIFTR